MNDEQFRQAWAAQEADVMRFVLSTPESDWQVEVADERGYWWLWLLIGAVVGYVVKWAVG